MNFGKPVPVPVRTSRPGAEGAIWRFVAIVDPTEDAMDRWVAAEKLRGTPGNVSAEAIGDVLATWAMQFAERMGDVHNALLGDKGVVKCFQRSLQAKVDVTRLSPSGRIILPPP